MPAPCKKGVVRATPVDSRSDCCIVEFMNSLGWAVSRIFLLWGLTISACLPPGLVDLCMENDGNVALEVGDIGCCVTQALRADEPLPPAVHGAPSNLLLGCTDIPVGGETLRPAGLPGAAADALPQTLVEMLATHPCFPSAPDLMRADPPPRSRSGTVPPPIEFSVLRL